MPSGLANRGSPRTRGKTVPAPIPASESLFVGRQAELALLQPELDRAMAGDPRLVVVEGEGGIGKTTLLDRLCASVRRGTVIRGGAEESEQALAWGVVTAVIAGIERLGHSAASASAPVPGADPLAVGAGLMTHLSDLCARGPVVIVLDDLHWCDAPSAAALLFAVRRLGGPVLTVAAARPPFPGDLGDGWRRLMTARGRRIRLGGLGTGDLVELADGRGRHLSGPAAARLHRHTRGHPLWAAALIEELSSEELEKPEGMLPVPNDLAGTIRVRHSGLSRPARALVAAASVLGERFPASVAAALAGIGEPAAAFQEAVEAGLLDDVPEPAGTAPAFRFPHPLVRSAVYQDLGPSLRSQLHGAATRLTSGADSLAHLAAATLAPSETVAADLEAGAAGEVDGGRLALAQLCLDAAVRLSPPSRHRRRRLFAAVESHLRAGDPARAGRYADEVAAGDPAPDRDFVLGWLARSEGRFADAQALLSGAWRALGAGTEETHGPSVARTDTPGRAEGWTDEDGALKAKVAVGLAGLSLLRRSADEAVGYARAALGARPWASTAHLARAIELIGLGLGGYGAEALALAGDAPPQAVELHELIARGTVKTWTDDLQGAYGDLSVAVERAEAGEPLRMMQPWALLSDASLRLGRATEASVHAELACDMVDAAGRDSDGMLVHTRAGYVAAAMGDFDRADGHAAAIARLAGKIGERDPALGPLRGSVRSASGVAIALALARGDPAALLRGARPAIALNGSSEPGSFGLGPVLAEALTGLGRLDDAEVALSAYEARAAEFGRRSALAGSARVRGTLLAARGDLAGAWAAFEASLGHAEGLPFELGRCHLSYGKALLAAARTGEARTHLAGARAIFADGGALAYVGLVDAALPELAVDGSVTGRGALTPAEQAVARLASRRLSNPEIAQQLAVSRKTVEYHLSHVYAKLGVGNRVELAQLADDLGG